jgi:hypothetical protein
MTTDTVTLNLINLHPKQTQIANNPARYKVVASGRRFGKTELAKDCIINAALDGDHCWWLSPVYSMATDVWHSLENTLSPLSGYLEIAKGERNIYFPGGGKIGVRSAHAPDNLRGAGLDFAVLDEAAFISEDVWPKIIRPMLLGRGGRAMFLSTPYGLNWFYDLFIRGEDPLSTSWKSWHFSSYDSPIYTKEELDEIRAETPERVFEEEYLAEFKADGGTVFRNVDKTCILKRPPAPYAGDFVMGVDWGKDVDYTVVSVWDADKLTEVEIDRYNQVGWQMQRHRIAALYERWKPRIILAEENSIGSVNIEALQGEGLPVRPFMTTARSKPPLIESLALAMERDEIKLLDDPLPKMELMAYQLTRLKSGGYGYEAPSGKHDDTVIARALAHHIASMPKMGDITILD